MSVHTNLNTAKLVAVDQAKKHNCNYNIVILNPDDKGEFNEAEGSTYEIVRDSYLDTPRNNVKVLHTTDELIKA